MPLSDELQDAVNRASEAMANDSEHALYPYYRRNIYLALGPVGVPSTSRRRSLLAIATAQHVSNLCASMASDFIPDYLLDLAHNVFDGVVDPKLARDEADKAWERLDELGRGLKSSVPKKSYFACEAITEALFETCGRDPFKDILIDEQSTDADLDPWSSDTVLWAVAAYAGRIGELDSSATKRQEFWEWWLQQAVPSAYYD